MPEPAAPERPRWEDRLPAAQQSFNRFCENWIFAFIVAMGIRHFALEAFRIPTASMEPMLYGDARLYKADHVVVDKLIHRFRGVQRWDVAVFQFPRPEVQGPGSDPISAIDADDERMDHLPDRPLMYRNFVKRVVGVPGDHLYIAHGDVFLQQPDGGWRIARKPDGVQEALWQEIYRHGAQPGYLPWTASGGCAAANVDGALSLTLTPVGDVAFTQPLWNLYVKPGNVRVAPTGSGAAAGKDVDATLTEPQFAWTGGTTGNIWDLEHWDVYRRTSADLDNASYGTLLNALMRERVGDLRVDCRPVSVTGSATLRLAEGQVHAFELRFDPQRWSLWRVGEAQPLAQAESSLIGHRVRLANIDDELVLTVDDDVRFRRDIEAVDPDREPTAIAWSGSGTLVLGALAIQRDVHYCRNGFLRDESRVDGSGRPTYAAIGKQLADLKERIGATEPETVRLAETYRLTPLVRAMVRGFPDVGAMVAAKGPVAQWEAWGYSPETAIVVPDHAYLMLGDNSPHSWDGRNWGFVPETNFRGRALAVVFPRWRLVR